MQTLDMIINKAEGFRASEAYKVARTNLMFSGNDIKAIVFTSSLENEGKTTVAWNMAISLAESGKEVLFVDADMRKSVFNGRNRIRTRTNGLSHYLSGQASLEEVIYSAPIEHLSLLTSGVFPPNPAELLSHTVFAELIEKLKKTYEYIIIDTPPLQAAIDAAIITSVCDASVLVISYSGNSRKLNRLTIEQLRKTGRPILGAILNKVETNKRYRYGKYYSKYYGKYYGYGRQQDSFNSPARKDGLTNDKKN